MTSLPEQLSAARTQQLDAQFQLFRSFASQALDNASRIVSLNLATSRESAERTSRAVHQLLGANDPRELGALRTHAEEQMRSLFAYSRALLSIATSAQPQAARALAAAAPAALAAPKTVDAVEAVVERSTEAVQESLEAAATAADQAIAPLEALVQEQALKDEPVVVQSAPAQEQSSEPASAPVAAPNPIARAVAKGAPKAAVAAHPLAAPVADKASAPVAPNGNASSKRRK